MVNRKDKSKQRRGEGLSGAPGDGSHFKNAAGRQDSGGRRKKRGKWEASEARAAVVMWDRNEAIAPYPQRASKQISSSWQAFALMGWTTGGVPYVWGRARSPLRSSVWTSPVVCAAAAAGTPHTPSPHICGHKKRLPPPQQKVPGSSDAE